MQSSSARASPCSSAQTPMHRCSRSCSRATTTAHATTRRCTCSRRRRQIDLHRLCARSTTAAHRLPTMNRRLSGSTMSSGHGGAPRKHTTRDGFEILDQCHRDALVALDTLSALVSRLRAEGDGDDVRAMAAEVVKFFSHTAREHHEDEERHVFPKVLAGADPETVQTVLRLQQDHNWLEED